MKLINKFRRLRKRYTFHQRFDLAIANFWKRFQQTPLTDSKYERAARNHKRFMNLLYRRGLTDLPTFINLEQAS